MKHLLIVGHGHFASGLKSALEMITGMTSSIEAFDFLENEDLSAFREKLIIRLKTLAQGSTPFCIGVDLLGGTPFISAGEIFLDYPDTKMLIGINLPTALEYLLNEDAKDEEIISSVAWFKSVFERIDEGGL